MPKKKRQAAHLGALASKRRAGSAEDTPRIEPADERDLGGGGADSADGATADGAGGVLSAAVRGPDVSDALRRVHRALKPGTRRLCARGTTPTRHAELACARINHKSTYNESLNLT